MFRIQNHNPKIEVKRKTVNVGYHGSGWTCNEKSRR